MPALDWRLPPSRLCWGAEAAAELLLCGLGGAAELRENFFFAEDQQFFAIDLDFGPAVLTEEHAIANVYVQRHTLALFTLAGADGDYFAFLRLFLSGIGDNDAALNGFLVFNTPHDHAVVERCD